MYLQSVVSAVKLETKKLCSSHFRIWKASKVENFFAYFSQVANSLLEFDGAPQLKSPIEKSPERVNFLRADNSTQREVPIKL